MLPLQGCRFDPWLGAKILRALLYGQKKRENNGLVWRHVELEEAKD